MSREGKLDRKYMRAHLGKGIWKGKTKKEKKRVQREAGVILSDY